MFRGVIVGLIFICLGGCATSAVLEQDESAFNSEAHRTAAIGAAVVTDAVVTPIAVAVAVKEASETIVEKVIMPVFLVGLVLNAISDEIRPQD